MRHSWSESQTKQSTLASIIYYQPQKLTCTFQVTIHRFALEWYPIGALTVLSHKSNLGLSALTD